MRQLYKKFLLIVIALLINLYFFGLSYSSDMSDQAKDIFEKTQKSVYQIRVINQETGNKYVIGSGFQFNKEGNLATNYHVVSNVLSKPKTYKLEYVRFDGFVGAASLVAVDVIHDLAVIKIDVASPYFVNLGSSDFSKGTKIYSMGNPHDLGTTIAEGIFNGLMEKTFYQKILFSGSINPGMSGGPALNHEGEVIGVNVSTAGNEISFLVPVKYLKNLLLKVNGKENSSVKNDILSQLLWHQDNIVKRVLREKWEKQKIGDVQVAGEIIDAFKCWSESRDKNNEPYRYAFMSCSSEDEIFISDSLSTGKIMYKYYWLTNKSRYVMKFYNALEYYYSDAYEYFNADKEEAKNFQCNTEFVKQDNKTYKVNYCARRYINYKSLYDINLSLATVDSRDNGFIAELIVFGVTKINSDKLVERFIKEIAWSK